MRAHDIAPTAETATNLGVALARTGRALEARRFFDEALSRFPEYFDARENIAATASGRITTHPLRRTPAPVEYPAGTAAAAADAFPIAATGAAPARDQRL